MNEVSLLQFRLDDQRYAVELACVKKVLRTVAIDRLPDAPGVICGVVNVQGQVIPVADLRSKFGHRHKPRQIEDRLVWVAANDLDILLIVDHVDDVCCCAVSTLPGTDEMRRNQPLVKGVVSLPDGILLIHDLAALLETHEQEALADALENA